MVAPPQLFYQPQCRSFSMAAFLNLSANLAQYILSQHGDDGGKQGRLAACRPENVHALPVR